MVAVLPENVTATIVFIVQVLNLQGLIIFFINFQVKQLPLYL
jgi:hypothetical protein